MFRVGFGLVLGLDTQLVRGSFSVLLCAQHYSIVNDSQNTYGWLHQRTKKMDKARQHTTKCILTF